MLNKWEAIRDGKNKKISSTIHYLYINGHNTLQWIIKYLKYEFILASLLNNSRSSFKMYMQIQQPHNLC